MTWRASLRIAVIVEMLILSAIALLVITGALSLTTVGAEIPFALHFPASLLAMPMLGLASALGLPVLGLIMTVGTIGLLQVLVLATLIQGLVRLFRRPRLGAMTALFVAVMVYVAAQQRPLPYPQGMDTDGDRFINLDEWNSFHAANPRYYGGYDLKGPISRDSRDYYEREFKRVDCNSDSVMDAYEYSELRWNARYCEAPFRPARPWWR